ncbi:MAG: SsrA-binding protein SmpB [Eubacteriales bacterium]|nr:SsrA-binding protein SmpB [Christensenellaceae bacterium]MDY3241915.1 SsrA-binding protein SmpB [Eubacteriales bacterium]MDY4710081.1 SsrA-binding protein SmpB [Eubacteriales bacterium]
MKKKTEGVKIIATNKKAYHDYFIEDTYEAGIALEGHEVKSLRLNNVNMKDSFAIVKNGEIWLVGVHISPYKMATMFKIDPVRNRRLLLHKSEINKLKQKVEQKGYTLVPTKMYFREALVKVEIGVARGKELHDKRDAIAEKENKRKIDRIMKEYGAR